MSIKGNFSWIRLSYELSSRAGLKLISYSSWFPGIRVVYTLSLTNEFYKRKGAWYPFGLIVLIGDNFERFN